MRENRFDVATKSPISVRGRLPVTVTLEECFVQVFMSKLFRIVKVVGFVVVLQAAMI
jgi:hypothetical protein